MFEGLARLTVFVFGLCVGSFLNVVIARLPEDQSIVRPGSRCPRCGAALRWWDNIPLVSYALLRGRCRTCASPISMRYPVVEFLTGLLFYAAAIKAGVDFRPAIGPGWDWAFWLRDLSILGAFVAIVFIDLDHRIIPDELSLGGLVLALATAGFVADLGWIHAILGAGLGYGFFFSLAWAYEKYSGKMGLGGGDVKLLAFIGAFLGPQGVMVSVLVSSIFGSVVGIVWGIWQKRQSLSDEDGDGLLKVAIPFGPFLVIGALAHYFFGESIWRLFMKQT